MKTNTGVEYEETIHIKGKMVCPVKQKNGRWTTIMEDYEEDIPDLGREYLMCNKCGWSTYPECMSWCTITKTTKRCEYVADGLR